MNRYYANTIATLRHERGWHQQDLAERLGCDPSDLGKWERGARVPGLEAALRLALLLGRPVEALFWDLRQDIWSRLRERHDNSPTVSEDTSRPPD